MRAGSFRTPPAPGFCTGKEKFTEFAISCIVCPRSGGWPDQRRVMDIVSTVLGPHAFVVRGLFFDKTPTANWNLPWHQDVTIAVKERREVAGFGPWTKKAGIHHAHAPADLLARMITVRIHLDPCGRENGPMRVLPGLHRSRPAFPRRGQRMGGPRPGTGGRLSGARRRGGRYASPDPPCFGRRDWRGAPASDPPGICH